MRCETLDASVRGVPRVCSIFMFKFMYLVDTQPGFSSHEKTSGADKRGRLAGAEDPAGEARRRSQEEGVRDEEPGGREARRGGGAREE